ncbi:MAG: PHP domain-containing protein [Hominenteromicrobium sp.]|uniref:PHP domain-containing protein n=1 Tax=Hominenteromicrobium sp. TaxID=3073581 RepID=UPI003999C0E6
MYNIIADLHTHSLASTHAYSTIREMVDSAAEKGLKAIAITDHARTMPGAPGPWFFNSMHELPLLYRGILFIAGMEANVIDLNGTLDINETERRDVNWLVASIHNLGLPGLENPTVEKCTQLWLNIAHDPKVNVIGHSGSPEFRYDYETVIPEFGRNHKLVEINAHSFEVRKANIPNCREIAFPEELILNANTNRLIEYLRAHTNILENRKDADAILRSFENV